MRTASELIARLEKPASSEFFRVMFYGSPGTGKTVLAAQAPNPMILDFEHGTTTLRLFPNLHNVPVFPVTKVSEVDEIFQILRKGELSFQTIVFDTITEFQTLSLAEINERESRKLSNMDDKRQRLILSQLQDYRESQELIRRTITQFNDLPINVVVIAHANEDKEELTGALQIRPSMTPKLATTISGLCDVVAYFTAEINKEGVYTQKIQVMPSRRVHAKTRLSLTGSYTNPTWNDITGETTNVRL